jgi:hypothetical protein
MSEILGTLFKYLMAILAVGAVVAIGLNVQKSNKDGNVAADISQLSTGVEAMYGNQATYTSLTPAIAINAHIVPQEMVSGVTLLDQWGGTDTLSVNASNATEFDIGVPLVPQGSCVKMATTMHPITMTINGTAYPAPLDAGTATTACTPVSPATTVPMVFTFGH